MRLFPKQFAVIAVVVFWSVPAFAYVDPGAGYLITQLLMGFGAGVGFFLLRFAKRLLGILKSRR